MDGSRTLVDFYPRAYKKTPLDLAEDIKHGERQKKGKIECRMLGSIGPWAGNRKCLSMETEKKKKH